MRVIVGAAAKRFVAPLATATQGNVAFSSLPKTSTEGF